MGMYWGLPQQIPLVAVNLVLAQIRPEYFYHHSSVSKNLHICDIKDINNWYLEAVLPIR
jgi:hypothetical protein